MDLIKNCDCCKKLEYSLELEKCDNCDNYACPECMKEIYTNDGYPVMRICKNCILKQEIN